MGSDAGGALGLTFEVVPIAKPEGLNVIIGQAHFIKTVDDVHEALVGTSPQLKFGVAFCEASGPRLVRRSGNDDVLVDLAVRAALDIGAGHSFVIVLDHGFPLNVLNTVKAVPEVCGIFAATANPLQVVVAVTDAGRGVLGVIDGGSPLGVETADDVTDRRELLQVLGYKL
ncbi:MAG: adenosine-specific kinase [Jiangellales bacterium]